MRKTLKMGLKEDSGTDLTILDRIKANEILIVDGVDFGSVIATDLYDFSTYAYFKQIIKCCLYRFTIRVTGDDKTRLFIYSLKYAKRVDYDEIKDKFMEIWPEYALVDVDRIKSLRGVFGKISSIIKNYIRYKCNRIPEAFLIAILVTEYHSLLKLYKKEIDWSIVKILGTFCDARCEDCIGVQLGKIAGAKTFTLQHGQYRILRLEHENCDAEIYKNFTSDILLAWGKATKDEFVKYGIDAGRIVPVGALKAFSFNKPIKKIVDSGVFGIIMSGENGRVSNIGMIKLANELSRYLGMKYYVRWHPRNNKSLYMKYIDDKQLEGHFSNIENEEYAKSVTFSIVHMTGVFVEMLSINSPIFIYDDEYLEDVFRIKNYCFSDFNQLINLYKYANRDWDDFRKSQYRLYRYFNEGEDIRINYRKALQDL